MFTKSTLIVLLGFLLSFVSFADEIEQGRQIYDKGILPNGEPLIGVGANDYNVVGKDAACANCHRYSGMGGVEGKTLMPPISANFLFASTKHPFAVTDPSHPMGITTKDHTYTDSTLANVISTGTNDKGRELTMVMPRYKLDKEAMSSLVAYLHQLSLTQSTGVVPGELHFATVFTPEVDEQTKQIVKTEIETFVIQHNDTMSNAQSHRSFGFDRLRINNYEWKFHFWELKGDPDTWESQLEDFNKQQAVFALVSGVSYQAADPVHEFCETHETPCLLRSELYASNNAGRYNLYFSKGLGLDANLFSTALKKSVIKKPSNVIQIFTPDSVGETVSKELSLKLKDQNIPDETIEFSEDDLSDISERFAKLGPDEIVFCWCEQADLDKLGTIHIPEQAKVYLSGSLLIMKSGAKELKDPWKNARVIYPFEIPSTRIKQLKSFYNWIVGHKFEASKEVIQSDVYFSMLILQEAVAQMVENLYKDYLVERVENIFGMDLQFWGSYARPGLSPAQRFANRSGYITKFDGQMFVPDSDRIIEE